MELKERFLQIYHDNITRDGADGLLKWLEDSDFFTCPASTKYHGSYEGGLLEHSLNVYDELIKELSLEGLSDSYDAETVAIVSLLHDVCKVNFYKKGTRNVKVDGAWIRKDVFEIDEKCPVGDHADKSVIILQNFIKLKLDEIFAIRAHMGFTDNAIRGGARFINSIFEQCPLAVLLHVADFKASQLMEGVKRDLRQDTKYGW